MKLKHQRIPTDSEYQNYDGGHCPILWTETSESWYCPGCSRNKREILRWTFRKVGDKYFWGWIAPLVRHHDHSTFDRFSETVICGDCNSADGQAKRVLNLPSNWSFSPGEIRQFVRAVPHGSCCIDYQKAQDLYDNVMANEILDSEIETVI